MFPNVLELFAQAQKAEHRKRAADQTPAMSLLAASLYVRRPQGTVVPLVAAAGPQPNDCHGNATHWCEVYPDHTPVRGWLYFDHGGLTGVVMFLSHSVVRQPDGTLIDITPQVRRQADYLFIPSEQSEGEYAAMIEGGVSRLWHVTDP